MGELCFCLVPQRAHSGNYTMEKWVEMRRTHTENSYVRVGFYFYFFTLMDSRESPGSCGGVRERKEAIPPR